MIGQVEGIYRWPCDGPWVAASAALVVVDMQRDHLDPEGWFALTGGDAAALRRIVPACAEAIALARAAGLGIVYTVEAHREDLDDLPANKLWRTQRLGRAVGAPGPLGRHLVRGEAGAAVVSALAPGPASR